VQNSLKITSAKYCKGQDDKNSCIKATIDGVERFVPIDPDKVNSKGITTYVGNILYAEIMKQVDAGDLTIEDAD
jgi:hypothetical protein